MVLDGKSIMILIHFFLVLRNTLAMSVLLLIAGFTIPIIFAVLLNELRDSIFKRSVQTISYLPHFVSWVVVAGIVTKYRSWGWHGST